MAVALAKAVEEGAQAVICASTGNTAASAAAYAARAGLPALVLQPDGAVALGKLAQARAHGARLLAVRGSFDDALAAARSLASRGTHALVNSLNPYRIEGQKTAAFEIVDDLGAAPEVLSLPYGGGGNTCAYAKGFVEADAGLPCILAAQSSERSRTVASAIRIATPVHEEQVTKALARTRGRVVSVYRRCHPRSLATAGPRGGGLLRARIRGFRRRARRIRPRAGTRVVCVITGHGLKDPEIVERLTPSPIVVEPDPDAIAAASR